MEKKDEYRFTLRFDENDRRQKEAATRLGQFGRKKARYVAAAICFYEKFKGVEGEYMSPLPDAHKIQEPYIRAEESGGKKKAELFENERKNAMKNLDASDIAAMKNGMNAFRRKKG